MLNKNSIKTILNVKHTCIDKVTMLADTSIMIEVHATKGEQCRCGICGKKSKFYDNGNEGARTWRACDWAGHKVILVGPSCRVNCKEHGVVTCRFPWARHVNILVDRNRKSGNLEIGVPILGNRLFCA